MVEFLEAVRKFFKKVRNLFPSAVPQGRTEFDTWAQDIIDTYGFPDNESVKFALCTVVMHLGPTAAYKSKHYFALVIKAGAAKQVANTVFVEIKTAQVEKVRQEQIKAEATANGSAVADSEKTP